MSFNLLCVYVKCTKWLGCETYVIAQKLLSSTHVWGEVSSHNAILPDFLICVFCAGNHIFKYSIKYVSKNLCFLSTEFLMNKKKYLWNLNAPSTYWVIRFCHVWGILQFFTAAHSSGCLNDRIAWFCHKTNFFFNSGKTYSAVCLEPTLQKFGMCGEINCLEKRFKICRILCIWKPKVAFSIFHFVLGPFFPLWMPWSMWT